MPKTNVLGMFTDYTWLKLVHKTCYYPILVHILITRHYI